MRWTLASASLTRIAEILANREGAERDGAPGVRLDEMPTGVEHDIPIRTLLRVLGDVVGQQGLREIRVAELVGAG